MTVELIQGRSWTFKPANSQPSKQGWWVKHWCLQKPGKKYYVFGKILTIKNVLNSRFQPGWRHWTSRCFPHCGCRQASRPVGSSLLGCTSLSGPHISSSSSSLRSPQHWSPGTWNTEQSQFENSGMSCQVLHALNPTFPRGWIRVVWWQLILNEPDMNKTTMIMIIHGSAVPVKLSFLLLGIVWLLQAELYRCL